MPAQGDLDLPPGFETVRLRESGDAFARACALAPQKGAGALVFTGRYDLVECAVVLEPDEPLHSARRALFAGMHALAEAVAAHCPPERPLAFGYPDALLYDSGLLGGGRLAWPPGCGEDETPRWLVFGFMLRAADLSHVEAGEHAGAVALSSEGFALADGERIIESFARHLLAAFDLWRERGFDALGADYLHRLPKRLAADRRRFAVNGDLVIEPISGAAETLSLRAALERARWYDPQAQAPYLTLPEGASA